MKTLLPALSSLHDAFSPRRRWPSIQKPSGISIQTMGSVELELQIRMGNSASFHKRNSAEGAFLVRGPVLCEIHSSRAFAVKGERTAGGRNGSLSRTTYPPGPYLASRLMVVFGVCFLCFLVPGMSYLCGTRGLLRRTLAQNHFLASAASRIRARKGL